jgi:hypothetical protein
MAKFYSWKRKRPHIGKQARVMMNVVSHGTAKGGQVEAWSGTVEPDWDDEYPVQSYLHETACHAMREER